MEKLIWNDEYNIGVETIDKAHARLFRIVNKLRTLLKTKETPQLACDEGIKYLENYTMKHFSEEEAYMRSIRYKDYAQHKRIHDNFRDKTLVSVKHDLGMSNYSPLAVERFLGIMTGWLTGHILVEDRAISGKVAARKRYDLSSEISIISRALNRSMKDILQLEAKLVMDDYQGENIGKGFYCRLFYDIDNGGKVQLLLGMEEQLALKAVGQVLQTSPTKRTALVNAAALQIFEQLFHHMGKLFRSEATYEIRADHMLTRDQFRSDFMKGYPCRLLFRTRLGYFIFCYRIWKAPQSPKPSGKTSSGTSPEAPAKASPETSAETSSEASPETSTETSSEASPETSAETSSEASSETSAEPPAAASPDISAEVPAESTREPDGPRNPRTFDA